MSNLADRDGTRTSTDPISRRRVLAGASLSLSLVAVAGCTTTPEQDPRVGDTTVTLTDTPRFDPERLSVTAGDRVLWVHEGQRPQTITAYERGLPAQGEYFASADVNGEIAARMLYPMVGALRPTETFAHTFTTPGTYQYFSIPAEGDGMLGTIVVR